jgi:hypothetical protein
MHILGSECYVHISIVQGCNRATLLSLGSHSEICKFFQDWELKSVDSLFDLYVQYPIQSRGIKGEPKWYFDVAQLISFYYMTLFQVLWSLVIALFQVQ